MIWHSGQAHTDPDYSNDDTIWSSDETINPGLYDSFKARHIKHTFAWPRIKIEKFKIPRITSDNTTFNRFTSRIAPATATRVEGTPATKPEVFKHSLEGLRLKADHWPSFISNILWKDCAWDHWPSYKHPCTRHWIWKPGYAFHGKIVVEAVITDLLDQVHT